MSDWDASENEGTAPSKIPASAPKPPAKKKWADEDEEEKEVASDWEASESEEEAKPPAKKPTVKSAAAPAPKKNAKSLKQAIAKKKDEDSGDTEDDMLDPAIKKRIERERELEADLKNASDLLGSTKIGSATALEDILKANPKTKDEFVKLSNDIIEVVIKRLQNKPLYATFVEHHAKELARPLKDVDVRKVASGLTALSNEKQRELKEAGKKKKAKPALGSVKPAKVDTRAYDEALDDFGNDADDFM
ncbi:Translation initiation factor 3 subunit J component [Tulasnella sp. 408]|nr:Translation initiation factor 3 subunit J component [Tulasnella sp. 408]